MARTGYPRLHLDMHWICTGVARTGYPRLHLRHPTSRQVTNFSSPLEVSANESCIEDASELLAPASYVLRVAPVSLGGAAGPAAEILLLTDTSAPEPSGAPLIHTGGASPSYQASACCLRVSWAPWVEQETALARYLLCNNASRSESSADACVDVGNATHVLISASATCECPIPQGQPAASASWACVPDSNLGHSSLVCVCAQRPPSHGVGRGDGTECVAGSSVEPSPVRR